MPKLPSENLGRNIGLAVVAALVILGILWLARTQLNVSRPTPSTTPVNKIENFEADKKPAQFPAEVPVESGARIVSNYNATSPGGRLQATQAFESSRSVAANFKLYNDYLTQNNWKILSEDSSKADLQFLIAQNDKGILNVSIHKGSTATTSIVDLSFLAN